MAALANKKRLIAILVAITLLFFALIIRIGWIQFVNGPSLQQKALDQWTRNFTIKADRGDIVDRNGNILAQSSSADTVALLPNLIKDPEEVAAKLAAILGMDAADIKKKASDKKKGEVWIKRQITSEQSQAIRALKLTGVRLVIDTKRYYPQKDFLTQVLGYTTVDGEGQEGIEAAYNKYLKGEDGVELTETDRDGNEIALGTKENIAAKDGNEVVLTIDYVIQYFLEKAMDEAMTINNPKGITGIVMNPKTGEILAMANKPDFDLNSPPRDNITELQKLSRNTAVSDAFEMGSTFKIITLSAALQEGVANLNSSFYCSGVKDVDGQKIKCWKTHGSQTLVEAVENSCNVAFMQMGLGVGLDKMYDYINKFGFGKKTNIDFTSDGTGIVQDKASVKSFDLARMSFGQSVAVTPLQLITAVSAAVNGGKLMQPYLVSSVRDAEGNTVVENSPKVVNQVISGDTSAQVRALLESVVQHGSGKNAQIPGYRVGGKTGTAQKYENGQVAVGKNVASFIGFAPADDPEIVVLFIVDEPQGVSSTFGSVVAAPYVKSIMEDTLPYLGIEPTYKDGETKKQTVEVPDVRGESYEDAMNELRKKGLTGKCSDQGGVIKSQMPQAGAEVTKGSEVLLYTNSPGQNQTPENTEPVTVPDVLNKPAAQARSEMEAAGLTVKLSGDGTVTAQSVTAGTKVPQGTQVKLTCSGGP
ncbi:MAG: stage V sporulation protein D [Bacillota bacterium]